MLDRNSVSPHIQFPLIQVVNEDDELLSKNSDAHWYAVLKDFPWENYCDLGASYYDALYDFNISAQLREAPKENNETKNEGRQRLLFSRATMDKSTSVMHELNPKQINRQLVSPQSISPGVVPKRLGGKKPKCFFALFKSFTGACLMGFAPEPLLSQNVSAFLYNLARS